MKGALAALAFAAVLAAVAYFFQVRESRESSALPPQAMLERVALKTKDNISIVGDYYAPVPTSDKGLLLLHMMPATRSSWQQFVEKMQASGWQVLAIDLRGHGESQGGPNGYKNFSDAEHQATQFDVETGAEFLKSKGVTELSLGGASIGANLALQYLADPPAGGPDLKAAFLLSPGLDYRSVKTEPAVRNLKPSQAVYYAASRDDSYSADTIRRLHDITPAGVRKAIKVFETSGHGTTIFEREPAFMEEIASWLQSL